MQYLGSVMISKGFDLESFNKNENHSILGHTKKYFGLEKNQIIFRLLHRPSDPMDQLDVFSKVPVDPLKVKEFVLH